MASPTSIDSIQLNFSQGDLLGLNIALAVIMYGVALELRWEDFLYIAKNPKGFFLGVIAQFLVLPFLTWALISILHPPPSVALGMFLVAACPGGNVSNFLSNLAKGNTALSVSLTAFSSVAAIFITPLNFSLWAGAYGPTASLLKEVSLDTLDVFFTVVIILGLPLALGILTAKRLPLLAQKIAKVIKPLSLVIFTAFVVLAFINNFTLFLTYIGPIFLWVLAHNVLALAAGFGTAKLGRRSLADTKTITIETGIQNSGLGLVLIFSYFDGLGGMAILTAWWGIWHLISGLTVATLWKNRI
jgi:BASS family bile acid:Na+ symporter